jgi:L-malate glycosyltransferase
MKICFLGDASSVHMHKWINFFKSISWEVCVISFKKYEIDGVKIISLGENYNVASKGGNFQYLFQLRKIKNIIREIKPDLVNAHYITSYGFIAALTKNTPLILSAWGTDILVTPRKSLLYKFITKYTLRKADLITSDSKNMTEEIEKLLGNSKRQIITVPMGVDVELFKNSRNLYKESIKILSLRTLDDNSNVGIIIKAFSKILLRYPNSILYVGNDGTLKKELIDLCKKLNIDKKVEFLGFIDREGIVKLFKECDYYISIPTSDATSVTLLEAMASGIYPIVSNIPANKEWIEDRVNGSVVHIGEDEILNSVVSTYKDFEYLDNVNKKNKEIINDRASLQSNMQYIKDSFQNLILKNNL